MEWDVQMARGEYLKKEDYLKEFYPRVSQYEFYRDVFPQGTMERKGHCEDRLPNAIFSIIEPEVRNIIMFDELDELSLLDGVRFSVCSPVTYSGRRRTAANAYHIHGFAIDIDYVMLGNLRDLFYQIGNGLHPKPTYVVNSGNGVHLYYLFHEPVPLYQYLYKPLNSLKYELTNRLWNQYTSSDSNKQFQGIFQGFRMVGNFSKLDGDGDVSGYPVTAYRTGGRVLLEELSAFVEYDGKQVLSDVDEFDHLTLDEAKERYPDWYDRRILKNEPRGGWTCKHDLYDWWIRKMKAGHFEGNRYYCIAALSAYAVKCGIPYEELERDALELVPLLDRSTENEKNHFTEQDVYDALEYYADDYRTYSIDAVVGTTKIPIQKNKRNGRKQAVHLAGARAIQTINDEFNSTNWRNGNGRKPKDKIVREWRQKHPEGKKADCHRDTGLDPKTIRKWWTEKEKK